MKRINAKRHSAAEKYAECCVPTAISQQMKPLLRKITTVMLASTLIILFFATNSCDKLRNFRITDDLVNTLNPPIPDSVFYIVGYDVCKVKFYGDTGVARGYVLVSEDLSDTLVTYNLPDTLFIFPAGIMPYANDAYLHGLYPFPQDYRFAYKIQITYRPVTEQEYRNIMDHAHIANVFIFPYFGGYYSPYPIFIISITKIQ